MEDAARQDQGPADEGQDGGAPATGTRLSAGEIYENVRVAAEEELRRPAPALLYSALAAGLTIGFSFFAGAFLSERLPPQYARLGLAAGYPLGFVFVVLARNQLFTENTLEPIIPLLNRPSWRTLGRMLSLWGIVLAGNLVGTLAFAYLAARTPLVPDELRGALLRVAEESTGGGFAQVGFRAIYAGWLIALMAWLIASTRATGAQVLLIWLTTAPIAALGFRHSIAGAAEAFYRVAAGAAGWGEAVGGFIAPAVVGNIVGGVTLVALLNHGQVAADRGGEGEEDEEARGAGR